MATQKPTHSASGVRTRAAHLTHEKAQTQPKANLRGARLGLGLGEGWGWGEGEGEGAGEGEGGG